MEKWSGEAYQGSQMVEGAFLAQALVVGRLGG